MAFHDFNAVYFVHEQGWQFVKKMWISGTNYEYEMECICSLITSIHRLSLFLYLHIALNAYNCIMCEIRVVQISVGIAYISIIMTFPSHCKEGKD